MKQTEYTEKQKEIIELIKPFKDLIKNKDSYENGWKSDIQKIVKSIENNYGIQPHYLTLREYLNEHSCGAYHKFIFKIFHNEINVINVEDFESLYKSELLDKYFVVDDKQESHVGDCCSYECKHYLKLEEREE